MYNVFHLFTNYISDTGSGVQEVDIAVGTTPDNTDLSPWTMVANSNGMNITTNINGNIPDGIEGWVKIRAINNGKWLL